MQFAMRYSAAFFLLSRALVVSANTEYEVIPYTNATATLSSNVKWVDKDPRALVDGKMTGDGVSYISATCDGAGSDIGYVTIDLGKEELLDGIRVYRT